MDARAMGCCHAPACVRVRTQPPCLFCACAIGRPALSRPRGDRCRQTCVHAIVAAVRSFGTSPARCRRHQVRAPTRVALRPTHAARRPGTACALAPSRRFASARPPVWPPPCAKRGVPLARAGAAWSPRAWHLPGWPRVRAATCCSRASFLRALPGGSWSRSLAVSRLEISLHGCVHGCVLAAFRPC